jgi:hypothetical protein
MARLSDDVYLLMPNSTLSLDVDNLLCGLSRIQYKATLYG